MVFVDGYIFEGLMVNVDLLVFGVIMVFGLMYLKTNDVFVLVYFEILLMYYGFDDVWLDYVMLWVVVKSLIMWDMVELSVSWIEGLLSSLLRDAMDVKFFEE